MLVFGSLALISGVMAVQARTELQQAMLCVNNGHAVDVLVHPHICSPLKHSGEKIKK